MLFLLIVWGLIRLQCGSADVRTLFVRQVEKRNTPKVFLLRQSQREKRLTFFEQDSRSSLVSDQVNFCERKKRVKPLPSAGAQYFGFAKSSIVCILFLFYH